jgi:HEAT repeat protein/putative sister chromatid cohesion protein
VVPPEHPDKNVPEKSSKRPPEIAHNKSELDHEMRDEDMSDAEFETMQEFYEELAGDYGDIAKSFEEQSARWRKKVGGDRLQQLLASLEKTIQCLEDPDPQVRELAIDLAINHWKLNAFIANRCEQLAASDPSPSVRCAAVMALAIIFEGQRPIRLGAMFARIVCDSRLSFEEHRNAYLALVILEGDSQRFSIPDVWLSFPECIDWQFVNSYLD